MVIANSGVEIHSSAGNSVKSLGVVSLCDVVLDDGFSVRLDGVVESSQVCLDIADMSLMVNCIRVESINHSTDIAESS